MLKGKVILVTGSSRGIGAYSAMLLAKNGASVVINYNKDKKGADKVAGAIRHDAGKAPLVVKADVSDNKETKAMVGKILSTFGRMDVLVNNASHSIDYRPIEDMKWSDFEKYLHVGLRGSFNVIKNVLPVMMKEHNGKIINILSSVTIGTPPPKPIDYISSKYALLGFSKALAVEMGPHGITVNCISPGMTDTDMIKDIPAKMKEIVAMQTPLKRLGRPEDVAGCVVFLASGWADFITGANIPVAGGSVM